MNDRTIKRLAIALAIAVVAWGVLALTRRAREDRIERLALPRVDTAAVDSIVVAGRTDTVVLARGGGGWTVNGHRADTARVRELLAAVVDSGTTSELIAQTSGSHVRMGVDADSGRRVRVVDGANTLLDLTAGKRTDDWRGVYVRRSADSAVYALRGNNLAESFTRALDDWRDRRIASVVPESVAVVELQRGARSVTLRRGEGGRWALGAGDADSAAVARLLDAYRDLTASGFATPAQEDSVTLAPARFSVRLTGARGAVLAEVRYDSTATGVWARADSAGPVFKLDAWRLSTLAPVEGTLRAQATGGSR